MRACSDSRSDSKSSQSAAQITSAISRMSSVAEPARRQRRGADPQARGVHRRALVEGDRVAVDGDPDLLEPLLGVLAVEALDGDVDEHEVDVGAAGEHVDPAGDQLLGEGPGVGDRLPLARAELLGRGDPQRHRLGGDDVHQRAALAAGEDRRG